MKTNLIVAALYVDLGGYYARMLGVDCWDEQRDAKRYRGPYPVVAHPPCGPWGKLRHMCRKQDPACGPAAVKAVRKYGGVLEHPAHSKLWAACEMPLPGASLDAYGGITTELTQMSWGHVARKHTWIYTVGVPHELITATMRTGGEATHWISGDRARTRRIYGAPLPPGLKHASAAQARRTPPAFAEWLVMLARATY